MQTLRPSQVPKYLRTSSFYLGLNAVDDDEFSIPLNHIKPNTNMSTLADITELLNTFRFWGLDVVPWALFLFVGALSSDVILPILEPYRADLPVVTTVCSITCGACCYAGSTHMEKAMDSGNVDVVRHFCWVGHSSFTIRAIALAAGKGALNCLQYALSVPARCIDGYRICNEVYIEAVRNGCMNSIFFLRQSGFSLTESDFSFADLAEIAASSGQYDVLKCLHSEGCSFDFAAIAAADAGYWDCLEYAVNYGAPLRGESSDEDVTGTLALRLNQANQLKLLVIALECACPADLQTALTFATSSGWERFKHSVHQDAPPSIGLITAAAQSGNIDCLLRLHQICTFTAEASGSDLNWYTYAASVSTGSLRPVDITQAAADAQQWESLRFLITHGCPMQVSLSTVLVQAGQEELFQLAVAHGCEVSVQVACQFARDGNLDLLQHALEHGCERSEEIVRAAARHGRLECLKYAHRAHHAQEASIDTSSGNFCPADIAEVAAKGQHWHCLQFLITHACPMNKSLTSILVHADQLELYHVAVAHGCEVSVQVACNLPLLQHALEHGCDRSEEIVRAAARHGQLQCLMYAHAQGCSWSAQVTLAAARGGHQECQQYLREQGCPSNEQARSRKRKRGALG